MISNVIIPEILQPVAPEATIRNHGPAKQDFGYNTSLAATLDFVREIRADTGSTSDVMPIPALLTAQAQHHDCLPAKRDIFISDYRPDYDQLVA